MLLGICDLIAYIRDEHERMVSVVNRTQGTLKRKRSHYENENDELSFEKEKDTKWSIMSSNSTSANATTATNSTLPILSQINQLYQTLHDEIPQLFSRILHASSSLYIELSRVYFVPFCTVCLGCISRIRTILMHYCNDGCALYHIISSFFSFFCMATHCCFPRRSSFEYVQQWGSS